MPAPATPEGRFVVAELCDRCLRLAKLTHRVSGVVMLTGVRLRDQCYLRHRHLETHNVLAVALPLLRAWRR